MKRVLRHRSTSVLSLAVVTVPKLHFHVSLMAGFTGPFEAVKHSCSGTFHSYCL